MLMFPLLISRVDICMRGCRMMRNLGLILILAFMVAASASLSFGEANAQPVSSYDAPDLA